MLSKSVLIAGLLFASLIVAANQMAVTNAQQSSTTPSGARQGLTATITTTGERFYLPQNTFRVGERIFIQLKLTNNSTNLVKVILGGPHAQNRLHLFKDGVELPYLNRISKLIQARDKEDSMVDIRGLEEIAPGKSATIASIEINDWYKQLDPGQYQIKLERNFRHERKGMRPIESSVVTFEVIP